MASFANSFWGGSDYAGGLGVLFGKLQQGVQENQQVLTIARMRADAEDIYGARLGDIEGATNRIDGGFQKDDGASTKKAYDGVRAEMMEASRNHKKIASNVRELVVNPFSRWCDQHAARVQNSQDDLQARVKAHDKQAEVVRQCRSQYYNKCRRVEDLDEEEKLAFQDPQNELKSPKLREVPTLKLSEPEADDDDDPLDFGDQTFSPEQVKQILKHMLDNIKLGENKVPILGTYQNVSSGADITDYIQKNMGATNMAYAERIGQDMIHHGFLRLIGNVGSTFTNSSRWFYQWRPKVFKITGYPEKKQPLGRSGTAASQDSFTLDSQSVEAVSQYLAGWNPLNNPHKDETPAEKLRREATESDEKYKASVRKLDALRCNLEEAMVDHFKFMERCELDRLKAVKSVILDFSGAISNVIPSLQSTVDHMMLFQETVQPAGDLRYLLENYRTGQFVPRVQIYENYYNHVDDQIFGVDVEARARADRKRVPIIVTTLLMFLDNKYPELEGDEARRGIWLVDVPLAATHHLRNAVAKAKSVPFELLEKYDIPIVASLLKLYLLELPDSLVSSHVYEIVKTIYTTTAPSTSETTRISVIQSTLGQLRLANIATLDAITTHFNRLIDLTSGDEQYITSLSSVLAPCILRPKQESSLSMTEKFNVRLLRDLLTHKEAIFGELKRASSLSQRQQDGNRQRAISTDESNRRHAMEERQRAIAANAERIRAPSPARFPVGIGSLNGRERSTSAETRFPIAMSAQTSPIDPRRPRGGSLEVPLSPPPRTSGHPITVPPPSSSTTSSPPPTNGTSRTSSSTPPPLPSKPDFSPSRTNRDRSNTQTSIPTSRIRSDTNSSVMRSTSEAQSQSPMTSASLSGPDDFANPGAAEYYANATEESASGAAVEKRNSLNRSRQVTRKVPTALGLQRQSLVSKRDSAGSMHGGRTDSGLTQGQDGGVVGGQVVNDGKSRVELTDRPMDD